MEPNSNKSERALREEGILQFWKEKDIFKKTLAKKSPKGDFVFYEGPPGANGLPHIGHLEARAFKDAIPRYKTMRGYHVERRAGWDTHGLPVEIEVEKMLGLKSKKEIEEYGVAKFNEECRKNVWKYVDEWHEFTDRMGYWVDFDNAYVTYHNSYIEAVWSTVAKVEERGLLYKDYKVVPWCPRCGTGLSSHELAQGYQDVKDLSLYVKFELKNPLLPKDQLLRDERFYMLAWTTTPWTLPGNVALAVNPSIEYVLVRSDGNFKNAPDSIQPQVLPRFSYYVCAKNLVQKIFDLRGTSYELVKEIKGSELVGLEYIPVFGYLKDKLTELNVSNRENAFKVYPADFVNTEDGTGIVHTAVMYGQDDFELGNRVNLPKYHLVNDDGSFRHDDMNFFSNWNVTDGELSVEILKDLQNRRLYFHKENHLHSYPFCWRCKTRLIYYARDSWYIRMSELRDELVRENQKINWEPDHIKEGRFGEWLREVKDWALSRERYWGTPLPVWQSASGKRIVVDSIDTLKKYTKTSGNKYFAFRHGEAHSNTTATWDFNNDPSNDLTAEGRLQVEKLGRTQKNANFDIIVCSPILRAKKSAEIFAKEIGFSGEIVEDERLTEFNPGAKYQGRPMAEFLSTYKHYPERYTTINPDGENYADIKRRVMSLLEEYEREYKGKKILFVAHGAVVLNMILGSKGVLVNEIEDEVERVNYPKNAEMKQIDFVPMPHNADFELDLHKPYIDEVVLVKDGEEYKKSKEVMDVWFDSGAMPFAQDPKNMQYPADFISEGVDQTRGWFYTLHAIGVLMGKGRSYKNVVCLGLINDKDGKKMSKSVGNVVSPGEMMDKYGVDALRLWMYSVNQPGESKNFDERTVDEINKRVFNLLDNVYSFLELYKDPSIILPTSKPKSSHVLDKWILVRLDELTELTTSSLEDYKLLEPVRAMREFVDDLSTWYLRRSRDRIKEGDMEALQTLYYVLREVSKLLAPFAPFFAEDLYGKLRVSDDPESVHLCNWPSVKHSFFSRSALVLQKMAQVRELVSLTLDERQKANIKVRQPLGELRIKDYELGEEYLELIKDEVNVKEVVVNKKLDKKVELDTTITPELEEEGKVREVIRAIQEWRKEQGLNPSDQAQYLIPDPYKEFYTAHKSEIESSTNVKLIEG